MLSQSHKEPGIIQPDGSWESRDLTVGEKMARTLAIGGNLPHRRINRMLLDTAVSEHSKWVKSIIGSVVGKGPKTTDALFGVAEKTLTTLGYNFEEHQMLDTRNEAVPDTVELSSGEGTSRFDYMLFAPGSLAPPLYGHQVVLNRLSEVSRHSSVLNGPTVHTNTISVLSAVETLRNRYQAMINYVLEGQKVGTIGHSLGSAHNQLALSLLTSEERAIMSQKWKFEALSVGGPQLTESPDFVDLDSESGLSSSFTELEKDKSLLSHFGPERLQNLIDGWRKNGFESLIEVEMPKSLAPRHLSLALEHDFVVPAEATYATGPAQNYTMSGAEHALANFVSNRKWVDSLTQMDRIPQAA